VHAASLALRASSPRERPTKGRTTAARLARMEHVDECLLHPFIRVHPTRHENACPVV
jgi:hypothetical protein